jgi:ribosome-binding ATPase YchF (GTP1/OBG family)
VRVALVGYTNVGKSTLMNVLSKSDVFAENKLFATLDTTVRKVVLGQPSFPAQRHGGLYPQAAPPIDRELQEHLG